MNIHTFDSVSTVDSPEIRSPQFMIRNIALPNKIPNSNPLSSRISLNRPLTLVTDILQEIQYKHRFRFLYI